MNKSLFILLILIIFGLNLNAQTNDGRHNDSSVKKYVNDEYNFSFELPKDWIILDTSNMNEFIENGRKVLKPNKKGEAEIKKSVQLTETLLNLAKLPVGSAGNASLICAVEINQTPEATIEQTATATKNSFVNNFGYQVVLLPKKMKLGNQEFIAIKIKKKVSAEFELFQTIFIKKMGDKVLQFVLTYTLPEDGDIMEESLQTLNFIK